MARVGTPEGDIRTLPPDLRISSDELEWTKGADGKQKVLRMPDKSVTYEATWRGKKVAATVLDECEVAEVATGTKAQLEAACDLVEEVCAFVLEGNTRPRFILVTEGQEAGTGTAAAMFAAPGGEYARARWRFG